MDGVEIRIMLRCLLIVALLLVMHGAVLLVGGILGASGDGSLLAAELYALNLIWPLLWIAVKLLPAAIAYDKSRAALNQRWRPQE